LALATERGQDDRSAESVEERELTGMSAFGGGAKSSARRFLDRVHLLAIELV
jgi:hypothetical protein